MTTPTTVLVQLKVRSDTAANWTSANPTLLANELGRETDTGKIKIGTGSTAWTALPYQPFGALITNADISATAEIAVSKLADGAARQLLQTDAAGTGVEWTSNVDIPGTLDVTGTATFDGAVTVAGDLTVNGTTTTIDTQTLLVEDKNIEMGVVATPTDVTADGGGITLRGTTNKTINWSNATGCWTSSENLDLAAGKSYFIDGAEVINGTSLGINVTDSSLTSVGTLGSLTVADFVFAGTFIPDGSTAPSNGLYLPAANTVAISTNSTGRLFIDSSGRLGIGSSNPGAPLDVVGSANTVVLSDSATNATLKQAKIQCRHYTSSEENLMMIYAISDSSANEINIGGGSSAQNYATQIGFWTAANNTSTTGTERLRITSGGNVGIGTTGPGNNLTVQTSSANGGIDIAYSGSTCGRFGLVNPGVNNDTFIGSVSNNDFRFYTNNTERARIDSSGRLLVGTSSASGNALLQVAGDLAFNSGYGSVAVAYGCRAWVNFNGTGTVAIRASGNVSSITDNGVGDYTVNFTTAMPDANYAAVASTQGAAIGSLPIVSVNQGNDQTTSKVDLYTTVSSTATATDLNYITVAVFR